jgi:hypothetical protein
VIVRTVGVLAKKVGAVVVDTASAWPPLVQVAVRAPAAVNVGKTSYRNRGRVCASAHSSEANGHSRNGESSNSAECYGVS